MQIKSNLNQILDFLSVGDLLLSSRTIDEVKSRAAAVLKHNLQLDLRLALGTYFLH